MTSGSSRRRLMLLAGLGALALVVVGCGDDDEPTAAGDDEGTKVEIEMVDVAFEPDEVTVPPGEVTFVFTNSGAQDHEAYIGDAEDQEHHAEDMEEMGDMDMHHEGGIELAPGETGELTYSFEEGDELLIGCHEPGHYESGMVVEVTVE